MDICNDQEGEKKGEMEGKAERCPGREGRNEEGSRCSVEFMRINNALKCLDMSSNAGIPDERQCCIKSSSILLHSLLKPEMSFNTSVLGCSA